MGAQHNYWSQWLSEVYELLVAGGRVYVPSHLDPAAIGFVRPPMAEAVGQRADLVRSLVDGGRLHIHVFDDCMIMHRDAIDPGRGVVAAAAHLLTETKTGKVITYVGIGTLICLALAAMSSEA